MVAADEIILQNFNDGYYEPEKAFTKVKWIEIIAVYEEVLESNGKCSMHESISSDRLGGCELFS